MHLLQLLLPYRGRWSEKAADLEKNRSNDHSENDNHRNQNRRGNTKNRENAEAILIAAPGEFLLSLSKKPDPSFSTLTSHTFIGDSGATCHMRCSLDGMYDLVPCKTEVTVGNSETMLSVSKGTYKGSVQNMTGTNLASP